MNKKFIYFKTKTQFTAKLSSLPNNAIVFIEDTKQIWTHGVFFDTSWDFVTGKPNTFAPAAHTLGSHSDVTITSNSTGEILKWNGSRWINNTLAEAGIATQSDIDTAIDSIEIGGRNLINPNDVISISGTSITQDKYSLTLTQIEGDRPTLFLVKIDDYASNYVLSFKADTPIRDVTRVYYYTEKPINSHTQNRITWVTNVESGDVISPPNNAKYIGVGINGSSYGISSLLPITFFDWKLEKGNKATDWTPAPEDQVSDWSTTDITSFSYIKNKPTTLSGYGITDAVTLNTTQTITGRKTFNTDITLGINASINGTNGAGVWNVNNLLWRFGLGVAGSVTNIRSEKVGIGTDNPLYKLDVAGTGRFTGNVTAPTFTGSLTGNASSATKLGTATVGSTLLPFYLNAGTATAITQANLRKGLFGTTAIGSTTRPIYIAANGVPTAITGSIANSTTGNAATATTATSANRLNRLGDNRNSFNPSQVTGGSLIATFSTQGALVNQVNNSDYSDVIAINTYSDSSAGHINALSFDKSSYRINHFMGAVGASTWSGFKTLAYLTDNVASATKVNNKLTLKFDTGTTENTNLYTYDGSAAKTIDIKAGSNVSFTKTANTVTISSANTNTTYTTGTLAQLNAGTDTTGRLQTAKLLNDWLNPKLNSKFDKTGGRLTAGTGDVNIELWRGTNASWNILNSGGYLRFQSNYTTVAGAYFDTLKLDYNTGNALFKGTVTAPRFNSGGTTSQYVRGDGSLATYTDTTYSLMSLAELNTGTATTSRVVNSKNLNDWLGGKGYIGNYHGALATTVYSYTNGCLVKTDISASASAMFTVQIRGNQYPGTINTQINFYSYGNTQIINTDGYHFGRDIGAINVFIYEGVVCLWFKQKGAYESFEVNAWFTNSGTSKGINRVASISNSAKPTTGITREITITPISTSKEGHTHTFASLTSKPSTLSGYGITDAYTKSQVDTSLNGKVSKSGDTMTGQLTVGSTNANQIRVVRNGSVNNANMSFVTNAGDVFIGQGYSKEFNVGGAIDLSNPSNVWMRVTSASVTASTFIGALSGNASSATYASTVTLTADNATNATRYPLFVDAATGNKSPRTDTGFTYNPSTGILTSTTFSGSLSGNASSATALTTSAGSATRPIYFSGGKPVQGTYTFGNASGNAPISNGVLNVNLNAAMLAGYTPSSFLLSRRMTNPSDGTSEQGAIPFILALKAAGRPVYTDPEFSSGNGNVSVYDNGKQGSVSITRVSNTSAANNSGYVLEITTTSGVAGPGRGGFYQNISARANAVFCQIFRAKIPVGFSVNNAENSMGTGSTTHWLTDKAGTGKWEWYCRVTICGPTGSFSNGGHVYLVGSGAVTWQLAYCNVIDLSKGEYDGLRTRFADSADTATVLTTSAGSATQPVYFSGGKPVATTYSLGKSVPSNAVFTDTTYSNFTRTVAGLVPAPGAATTTRYLREDGTWVIPPNTNTTYSAMSASEITAGTATTSRTITSKVLNDWINGKGYITSYVDTTYTAGTGLTLSGTQFSLPITVSGSGTYVRSIAHDTNGNGISVTLGTPPNTNTTYSAMSVAEGQAGTATTSRTVRADYLKEIIQYYAGSSTGIRAGASGTTTNATATNPYIKVLNNGTYGEQIRLLGGGATTVKSDASGNVTISSTNTVYTHPTSAGNKHIPTGGSANQILRWSSSGTAVWSNENTGSSYSHPTGDGNLHVPATGTTNNGRVLKAGATAGSISWGTLGHADVGAAASSHTHSVSDITNITSARLLGRYSTTTGAAQMISIGGGLTLSGGALSTIVATIGSTKTSGRLVVGSAYSSINNLGVSHTNINVSNDSLYATAFYESSDEKLKIFKQDIKVNFDKLKQIPKKYFTWKDDLNSLDLGTSAQEIQKIYPELVSENNDGILTVNYAKLSIIALAAIDELNNEIQKLKNG